MQGIHRTLNIPITINAKGKQYVCVKEVTEKLSKIITFTIEIEQLPT